MENLADDMMEVAHSNVYQNVIDVFGDGKSDGFFLRIKYMCVSAIKPLAHHLELS